MTRNFEKKIPIYHQNDKLIATNLLSSLDKNGKLWLTYWNLCGNIPFIIKEDSYDNVK